jgi:signal transduction histidine kinase
MRRGKMLKHLTATLRRQALSLLIPSRAASQARTFDEFCRERFDLYARVVMSTILVSMLLLWPLDLVILPEITGVMTSFAMWRTTTVALCALYLVLPRAPALRAHLPWISIGVWMLGSACVGYAAGRLGGPERPWLHLTYVLPSIPLVLPMRLGPRAVATGGVALATLAGFLLRAPEQWASPFMPLSIVSLTSMTAISIAMGHWLFVLLRENFTQARALAVHAEALEARVAERTDELQRLLSRLETAREEERRRVAQDLHDELGQELAAMRLALGLAVHRYERTPLEVAANLTELDHLLERTRASMRGLITMLRPRVLDDLGLAAAAEWLLQTLAERAGLRCRLEADPAALAAIGPAQGTAAFRIMQESLTNAVKHAHARSVEVSAHVAHGALELQVRDDGRGIGRPGDEGGLGLLGMRERARALGGTLEVRARAEGGTEVRCSLPLGPELP